MDEVEKCSLVLTTFKTIFIAILAFLFRVNNVGLELRTYEILCITELEIIHFLPFLFNKLLILLRCIDCT